MKIFLIVVAIATTTFLAAQPTWAQTAKEITLFAAGLGAGFINHELLGHQFVASLHGGRMEWRLQDGSWRYYDSNKSHLRDVALGGTAAEMISSEIILRSERVPKDNAFILGWLVWNIANPLLYVARHELDIGSRENNDLAAVEKTAGRTTLRIVEGVKISHAIFTAYRMWKSPDDKKKEPPRLNYYVIPSAGGEGVTAGIQYRW